MTRHSGSWGAPVTFPIRAMRPADAPAVLAIYQDGLDSGEASFETTAPDWAAFDAAKLPEHRWVATDPASGEVIGWVAVSPVSDRCVYAGVVEHTPVGHRADSPPADDLAAGRVRRHQAM